MERHVLGQRELEHEAAALAILRDVADARVEDPVRARVREISACDRKAAALDLSQARERLDQLRLAVAVDAGYADDLSGTYLERHPTNGLELPLVQDVEVSDVKERLRRFRG